jgi:hypothetical protein
MEWTGHGASMEEKRNTYRVLVGKPEGKRQPLGTLGCRQDNNIIITMARQPCMGSGLLFLRLLGLVHLWQ